jgi:hypothetical protein
MNAEPTEDIASDRFVAFLDVLGFGDLVAHNDHAKLLQLYLDLAVAPELRRLQ